MKLKDILIATLCGIIIGFIGWFYLSLVHNGLNLFWEKLTTFLSISQGQLALITMPIGGIMVSILFCKFGVIPEIFNKKSKEIITIETHPIKLTALFLVYSLLIILIGSSIGPESALIGLFVFMMIYVSFLVKNENVKKITILFSVLTFITLNSNDAYPPFFIRFPIMHITNREVLFTPILFLIGLGLIYYQKLIKKLFKYTYSKIHIKPELIPIFSGIIIAIVFYISSLFLTNEIDNFIMFSGETAVAATLKHYTIYSGVLLLIMGISKITMSYFCINFGFEGGLYMPAIYSAFLIGFCLINVFKIDLSYSLLLLATASSSAVSKKQAVVVPILMFLFFGPFSLLISTPILVIYLLIDKKIKIY